MATIPGDFSTLLTTNTSQTSLIVGGTDPNATSGTGGANLGTITINPASAPSTTAGTLYNTAGGLIWATVPVVTGSGTTGQIPLFTTGGSGILGDSVISQAGGNITIGGNCAATEFIGSGAGLSTGTIPGTALVNTAVTPGTYGTALKSATFTVDQQGRITAASSSNINAGMILLYTNTIASASGSGTIDSYALASQLTSADALYVKVVIVGSVATPTLKNITDNVTLYASGANTSTTDSNVFQYDITQGSGTTVWFTASRTYDGSNVGVIEETVATTTAAWTGNWSIGLTTSSITGTAYVRWQVYKVIGQ
jgi:hypothetical protein